MRIRSISSPREPFERFSSLDLWQLFRIFDQCCLILDPWRFDYRFDSQSKAIFFLIWFSIVRFSSLPIQCVYLRAIVFNHRWFLRCSSMFFIDLHWSFRIKGLFVNFSLFCVFIYERCSSISTVCFVFYRNISIRSTAILDQCCLISIRLIMFIYVD